MDAVIKEKLAQIEQEEGVTVLYAVESGSRAWGFASTNSDYDVRFIYVRSSKEYLRLEPPRDVIERPIDDELDIVGWDLYKTLRLVHKSNPSVMEWLDSPHIYVERGLLAVTLREWTQAKYSMKRLTYHYLHMARRHYTEFIAEQERVILKKYLYTLRAVIAMKWIEERGCTPPTPFAKTVAGIDLPLEVEQQLNEWLEIKKRSREKDKVVSSRIINTYIEGELQRLEERVPQLPDCSIELELLDKVAWEQVQAWDHKEDVTNR
ncbi:nucleotidyltransferase domain-containing protein [Mechercharimyces sp. CAU 1602]|uniref:nucleotidyltransferase domain-containing protein n=1 Tax=Mechercharimyces sp. CAU 1602 TaxID=2973933 RepID=UPI002162A31F|nr:nucleotidyltransferase domain-containing protein [Mechercharimyces sp. CAU 1602]MCS1350209.1 nucleotidyltransferase domain-containing protein [Mechercharimyces sp. CAU 1602]